MFVCVCIECKEDAKNNLFEKNKKQQFPDLIRRSV